MIPPFCLARVRRASAVLSALALLVPAAAEAQVVSRLALRFEGGVGTMLSTHGREGLGYNGPGFQGSARFGFTVAGPLVLQASMASWWFPRDASGPSRATGSVLAPMGGLRIEPRLGSVGRLFIDGNAGLAFTGNDRRFVFDAGLGFEFAVTRWVAVGPAVRLGMVFQQATVGGIPQTFPDEDAIFWSGGLSLSLRVPEDEVATARDTDNDGVMDPDDVCVDTPQGDHPDPSRRGCPIADTDGDGVYDNEDQCVNEPAGATPDPSRRGCPRADTDHDGVFDDEDQCVNEPAGARPSTTRRGCPAPDADHDGIIDQPEGPDRCPTQPETFNGRDDEDGCPDGESLAIAEGNSIRILQQVNFRIGSDVIVGRQSFQVLDSVVSILRAMSNLSVDIQGHTDDVEVDAADLRELSIRRVRSVRRYLVAHGINVSRLDGHGFGLTCPMIPGPSRAARAANRRVQFQIISSGSPTGRCVNRAPSICRPLIVPANELARRYNEEHGPDSDGDGIRDIADHCPDEPLGPAPNPRCAGCPADL